MSPIPAEAELLEDVYRRFVYFVLYARQGDGTWNDEDELTAFTVHLGDPVVICINDEPHGYRPARSLRAFEEGEVVDFSDVETTRVARPSEIRAPYVQAKRTDSGWRLRFDFSRQNPRAAELLETGDEFLGAAENALEAQRLRAFAENAFHAAESYAKAELLSYPVAAVEIEGSKKHTHIQSAYDLWARLENTDKRFPALLRLLRETRERATYADGEFSPDRTNAVKQLKTLRAQRDAARTAVSGRRRRISVIATRDIEAGRMVSTSDATLRPPKRPRPS